VAGFTLRGMHAPFAPTCRVIALVASSLVGLTPPVHAQVEVPKAAPASAEAVAACERAARQALAAQSTASGEVTFNAPPAVQTSLSTASQVVLRGGGRAGAKGGSRGFTYNCNVDLGTDKVVGLVLRDTVPAAPSIAPARMAAEPDLTQLSPTACESRAAQALKQRWPRVSQISFDSDTRRFVQKSPGRAELHSHGRALPEPESPSTHFGFDCEIDTRDGRVVGMRVTG
jgi:hypothetical protein